MECHYYFVELKYYLHHGENIEDRKSITIFKSSKLIYMYYMKRGFKITALHVDGEFAPLQSLIQGMIEGVRFNL